MATTLPKIILAKKETPWQKRQESIIFSFRHPQRWHWLKLAEAPTLLFGRLVIIWRSYSPTVLPEVIENAFCSNRLFCEKKRFLTFFFSLSLSHSLSFNYGLWVFVVWVCFDTIVLEWQWRFLRRVPDSGPILLLLLSFRYWKTLSRSLLIRTIRRISNFSFYNAR